jgi:hypothetical protein
LGCCISPCYGPFSLGGTFDTYEPFISLIFNFFSGRGKQWIRWHGCILQRFAGIGTGTKRNYPIIFKLDLQFFKATFNCNYASYSANGSQLKEIGQERKIPNLIAVTRELRRVHCLGEKPHDNP